MCETYLAPWIITSNRVVISNDLKRQPHTLFGHYNQRGKDEKSIAELKNEYALGSMVSGDYSVTKALVWVSFLAFTLIGMFRRVVIANYNTVIQNLRLTKRLGKNRWSQKKKGNGVRWL